MKILKMVIVLTLFIFLLSMILSCENKDLVEYDGITYQFVEEKNIYDGSVDQYYSVESVPKDWTEVTIPEKIDEFEVKCVNPSAFDNCTKLKSVSLPDGITYINDYAFKNCTSLTELKLPKELEHVGGAAFLGCINLNRISVDNNQHFKVIDGNLYSKNEKILKIYLPSKTDNFFEVPFGIEEIDDYAFVENKYLTKVILCDGLKNINNNAFNNCESLEAVEFPQGLDFIGSFSFYNCKKLKTVYLPETVKKLGISSFENCTSLEEVKLPSQMLYIDNGAFSDCINLKTIYISSDVERMGYDVFKNCSNLTVYCEAEIKPQKWESNWYGNATVVWGATAPNEE